jgi:hypothetical protein
VTSKQVDDILQRYVEPNDISVVTVKAICRDWLDMDDELAAAQRRIADLEGVVSAARKAKMPQFYYDHGDLSTCVHCGAEAYAEDDVKHHKSCEGVALRDSIAALDAEGRGGA